MKKRSMSVYFRQGWTASSLITIIIAITLIWVPASTSQAAVGASKNSSRGMIDQLVASVNSKIILQSDIRKFRETLGLRSQLDPLFAGTEIAQKGDHLTQAEIVNFLIDESLILQSFPKTDSEVEQEIKSIETNNRLTRSRLKEELGRAGYAFSDYFELVRASSSKRDLIDREIRSKAVISDEDIRNFYYNHLDKATATARSFHIKIIAVSFSSYKTPEAASDVAKKALKSIQSGESFEEVARRMSDHATAASGGELGFVSEDQVNPAIRDQLKKLKIGEVSEIFGGKNAGGYFIVKLVNVKVDDAGRFDQMKEQIRNQLTAKEFQHQVELWLNRQKQTAFVHKMGETSPLQTEKKVEKTQTPGKQ